MNSLNASSTDVPMSPDWMNVARASFSLAFISVSTAASFALKVGARDCPLILSPSELPYTT
jgi:hypothetical protein